MPAREAIDAMSPIEFEDESLSKTNVVLEKCVGDFK